MRFVLIAATLVLCGCAAKNNDGPANGLSRQEADKLNADRNPFEHGDDPAFTAETHYSAGRLAESQNALPNAVEQYQAALKTDAGHRPSLYRLAVIYVQLRQYPQAIVIWERYVKATGGDANSYSNLGYACEMAGDTRKAEESYLSGIKADAQNEACRVNYGLMLVRLGRVPEAEKQLAAVLPPAQVRYNIGSAYEYLGQTAKAQAEYRKALELDPNLEAAKVRLAEMR
jgi:tetratricopeptide (TPR) repeat protein